MEENTVYIDRKITFVEKAKLWWKHNKDDVASLGVLAGMCAVVGYVSYCVGYDKGGRDLAKVMLAMIAAKDS